MCWCVVLKWFASWLVASPQLHEKEGSHISQILLAAPTPITNSWRTCWVIQHFINLEIRTTLRQIFYADRSGNVCHIIHTYLTYIQHIPRGQLSQVLNLKKLHLCRIFSTDLSVNLIDMIMMPSKLDLLPEVSWVSSTKRPTELNSGLLVGIKKTAVNLRYFVKNISRLENFTF